MTKFGVVWQKLDFWAKKRVFGPRKIFTSLWTPCSGHDREMLCKLKNTPFPNKDQSFSKFWLFYGKNASLAEKHFLAERKNSRFCNSGRDQVRFQCGLKSLATFCTSFQDKRSKTGFSFMFLFKALLPCPVSTPDHLCHQCLALFSQ